MTLDIRPKAIREKYGVYLCYYLAESAHVRLMGNILAESDSWVSFPADPDNWEALCVLYIAVWENAVEWYNQWSHLKRDIAWEAARKEASTRKQPTLFNEWYSDGRWHVSCVHAKGNA